MRTQTRFNEFCLLYWVNYDAYPLLPDPFKSMLITRNGTHNNHGFSVKNGCYISNSSYLLNTSPFLPLNHDLCRAPHARSFEMTDTLTAYDVKESFCEFFAEHLGENV